MNKTVKTTLTIQLIAIAIAIAIAALFSVKAAYSALIGGAINFISTTFFATRMFAAGPGSSADSMLHSLVVAELVKIALTVVLFSLVLLYVDVSFPPLFTTYAVTMLAYWLVLPLTTTQASNGIPTHE
ncbi:MAG: ATP synthase subunit I [Candidatus Competibacterales bacterium]